jgi:uncharacterized protein YjbI with pentapeptide repeats
LLISPLISLEDADLNSTNLSGANLSGADLAGSPFPVQNFSRSIAKYLTPKQVKSACNWKVAKFDWDFRQKLEKEPDQQVDCSKWRGFP